MFNRCSFKFYEMNRLISKECQIFTESNCWEKLTFSKLQMSNFKKLISGSDFGALQLTQKSLDFKTSCCNLKIRGLGTKAWVAFLVS